MKRGILIVSSDDDLRHRARLALPPEHRVTAIRPKGDFGGEEWLIEGPHMPSASEAEVPAFVYLNLTMTTHPDGDVRALVGSWSHSPDVIWPVDVAAMGFGVG